MKRLLIDTYKIIYNITKASFFAFLVSLLYITLLNVISIYGLSLLLEGWMVPVKIVNRMMSFPFYYLVPLVVLIYNYNKIRRLKLSNERKSESFYAGLIIYSFMSVLLYLYIFYRDKIF